MQGTIKKLVVERGFGFITGTDGKEYFFHHSALVSTRIDTLEVGDPVHFEEDTSRPDAGKGPRAGSVRVVQHGRHSTSAEAGYRPARIPT